jgi:sugar lactone lactonase YvrE
MRNHEHSTPRIVLTGLALGESLRWHQGRVWFADWGPGEIVAIDHAGRTEGVARAPAPPLCFDFLPDGRLVIPAGRDKRLLRQEPDGSLATHADLAHLPARGWNEIVVDGRGNIYLDGFGFDFLGGEKPEPGIIAVVRPDGSAAQVAAGIEFPNGMVVTPDDATLIVAESMAGRLTAFDVADDGALSNRRVWADGIGPDGITLDDEDGIWTHSADTRTHTGRDDAPEGEVIRVRKGGEILERIVLDRAGFACALGGPDGRHLFMGAAEWRGTEEIDAALADRTGQILVTEAPAAHAGRP